MDDLDLVRAAGDVGDPTDATVGAQRAALARSVAQARPSGSEDTVDGVLPGGSPERPAPPEIRSLPVLRPSAPRRRRPLVTAAAAVLVVAGVLVASRGGGDPGVDTSASSEPPAPGGDDSGEDAFGSRAAARGTRLAEALRGCTNGLRVVPPESYKGPLAGPSPDATEALAPAPGQEVLHWRGPNGSIELRWPSTAAERITSTPGAEAVDDRSVVTDEPGRGAYSVLSTDDVHQPAAARPAKVRAVLLEGVDPECRSVDVHVYADEPAAAQVLLDQLTADLFDPGPLVVGSRDAAALPAAEECQAPQGIAVPPNRAGVADDGRALPTAQEALQAFLVGRDTWVDAGYTELRLGDGSVAYVYEPEPGFFPVVVHVVEASGGWTVTGWETAGC